MESGTHSELRARSDFAAELGVGGQRTDAQALHALLSTESDPGVQLVIRYALSSLGEPGQLASLPATCRDPSCRTAVMLAGLTPALLKTEADTRTLAAYTKDDLTPRSARYLAVDELASTVALASRGSRYRLARLP